jgi:hypothetical protein
MFSELKENTDRQLSEIRKIMHEQNFKINKKKLALKAQKKAPVLGRTHRDKPCCPSASAQCHHLPAEWHPAIARPWTLWECLAPAYCLHGPLQLTCC